MLEPREALSFETNIIVTEQTLKLFESLTCLENGTLLPSGITDFATGFGYFLFSDCGSQENLSCTCECFVLW